MGWITKVVIYMTLSNFAFCRTENDVPKYCDFIVVGSGAGGATVAARLSEVSEVTVCLFEAGIRDTQGPHASTVHIPRLWTSMLPGDYTWNTTTTPQSSMNNRVLFNGMGKALGGSTTHNGLSYFRGFKADFDYWEEKGAVGWNYEAVLPYFRKSENMTIDELKMSPLHNTDGPMTISRDQDAFGTPLGDVWKRSADQLSIPVVKDCNGPSPFGLCTIQKNIRNGRRQSTSTAFLNPAMGRRNLFVITEALVSRILIHKKKAYGIRYIKYGRTYTVRARREVIVSGGTFESAKLLQLSGIGSKNVLQKLKVRPNAFLPVGENFQDHILMLVDMEANVPVVTLEDLKDPNSLAQYLFKSSGLWASNGALLNMFIDFVKQKHNWPEIQFFVYDNLIEETPSSRDVQAGKFPERKPGYLKPRKGTTLGIFLSHPKSRGIVRARSNDPNDTPFIDPRYFSNNDDFDMLIKGIRYVQKIFRDSSVMRKVGSRLITRPPVAFGQESVEQCYTSTKIDSDEFWKCVLRQQSAAGLHAVRSCPMGAPNDRWAVVDPKSTKFCDFDMDWYDCGFLGCDLDKDRVYGIKGLRVVDASVMPEVSSGNPMGPAIMIGERAADFIKSENKLGNY